MGEWLTVKVKRIADGRVVGNYNESPVLFSSIDLRPLPPGISRPDSIRIEAVGEDDFVGHWDIEDAVGGYEELAVGDMINLTIEAVNEQVIVGRYNGFPVQYQASSALPSALVGETVEIEIHDIAPDRATAELVTPSIQVGERLTVEVNGIIADEAVGTYDGSFVRIPSVEILKPNDVIAVGVQEIQHNIIIGEVSALPEFRGSEDGGLLIRLPTTTGQTVYIDDIPILTRSLPEIEASVTLGIEAIATDHIQPSITALPSAQRPDLGDSMIVSQLEAGDGVGVGVEEGLPIELPFETLADISAVLIRVTDVTETMIRGVPIISPDTKDKIQPLVTFSAQFQMGITLFDNGEYTAMDKAISESLEWLPSDQPMAEAVATTQQALLQTARAISDDTLGDLIDNITEAHKKVTEICEASNASDHADFSNRLTASKYELLAVQQIIIAFWDRRREIDASLQALARGTTAMESLRKAASLLRNASDTVNGTSFEDHVPSPGLQRVLWLIHTDFPVSTARLDRWKPETEPTTGLTTWEHDLSNLHSDGETINSLIDLLELDQESTAHVNDRVWKRPTPPDKAKIFEISSEEVTSSEEDIRANTTDPPTETEEQLIPDESDTTEVVARPPKRSESDKTVSSADSVVDSETVAAVDEQTTDNSTSETQTDASSVETSTLSNQSATIQSVESERKTPSNEWALPSETAELRRLRAAAENDAMEDPSREVDSTGSGSRYRRSPAIRDYVMARAAGICEACGKSAPFEKPNGEPYLEAHHVDELGDGGADDPALVVAICPTCHRKIHHGKHGETLNERLRERLETGLGDVGMT